LNLLGEADDYTTATPCVALAKKYQDGGTPLRTIIYPRANHSWDAMYKVLQMPSATSAATCGVVRWDVETWKITAERTGETLLPANFAEFMQACTRRGGMHVGRDETAFRQSRSDAQEFAKTVFFGSSRSK
jgi:dienelactone hydrolase